MKLRQETNTRTKTGRATIDDMDRANFSKRAQQGIISVKIGKCPYCFHTKLLSKPKGKFCCKCRKRIGGRNE